MTIVHIAGICMSKRIHVESALPQVFYWDKETIVEGDGTIALFFQVGRLWVFTCLFPPESWSLKKAIPGVAAEMYFHLVFRGCSIIFFYFLELYM